MKQDKNKIKKKSFFDHMRIIVNTKNREQMENDIREPTFGSTYSKYMLHRYLSMEPTYLKIISEQQEVLENMKNEDHYRYLFKIIPQNRNLFIRYISKKKSG